MIVALAIDELKFVPVQTTDTIDKKKVVSLRLKQGYLVMCDLRVVVPLSKGVPTIGDDKMVGALLI